MRVCARLTCCLGLILLDSARVAKLADAQELGRKPHSFTLLY